MPRRRASIAASISAAAAGGALRYRASSSGAPARNWITSPSGADRAASTIRASARPGELAHLRRGERGGHGDVVPGQQLPRLGVPVVTAGRAGGQGVPEPGPHGGQHQHRGPAGVAQQLPQPGGDPLAQPGLGRVEVELGLVQPHHGPRPDARQLPQRRIGAGRVDRMPQPPRRVLVPQQGQGLPAGPGLARGGPADQHRDPAAAVRRRAHHLAQHLIVLARHIRRQDRQPRRRVLGLHRPVHLQDERVGHLLQRPPRHRYAAVRVRDRCLSLAQGVDDAGRNLVGKVGEPVQDLRRRPADERRHLDDRTHVQLAAPVQGRVVERAARLAKPGGGLRPGLPGAQPTGELRRVDVDGEQRPVGEVRALEGVAHREQRCRALAVVQPPKLVGQTTPAPTRPRRGTAAPVPRAGTTA